MHDSRSGVSGNKYVRRFGIFLFIFAVALLGLWFFPQSKEEREFASLLENDKWQLCDYKRGADRRFVLRLYSLIKPILRPLRRREDALVRRNFEFTLKSVPWSNTEYSHYWDNSKEVALNWHNALSLRHWIYWENGVNELIEWDRTRLTRGLYHQDSNLRFEVNDSVERVSKNEFRLYLNPGHFEAAQEPFKRIIEKYWSLSPFKLTVTWTKTDPRAFKFVFDPFGTFNHVNYDEKKIYLGEELSDGALVHEVGHVLGFADHYQVIWNEKNCKVEKSAYLWDVMANHSYKHVLRGHWRLLQKGYPLKKLGGGEKQFKYHRTDIFVKGNKLTAN